MTMPSGRSTPTLCVCGHKHFLHDDNKPSMFCDDVRESCKCGSYIPALASRPILDQLPVPCMDGAELQARVALMLDPETMDAIHLAYGGTVLSNQWYRDNVKEVIEELDRRKAERDGAKS